MPGDHPHRRRADDSRLKSVSELIADYRAIIYPLTILALWLGFTFSTPSRRLDALEAVVKVDHVNVSVLVRLQCFNPSFNDEQRALAGLEGCTGVRQGLPDPSIAEAKADPQKK